MVISSVVRVYFLEFVAWRESKMMPRLGEAATVQCLKQFRGVKSWVTFFMVASL